MNTFTITTQAFFDTTPYILSFGEGEYGIYTIFLAYRNHGLSAKIPCDVIFRLHFVKLPCQSFALIFILDVAIKFEQFAVFLCAQQLVIILSHKPDQFITCFAYLIGKSNYLQDIRIRHISFSNKDMPVGKFMKLLQCFPIFFFSHDFSVPRYIS